MHRLEAGEAHTSSLVLSGSLVVLGGRIKLTGGGNAARLHSNHRFPDEEMVYLLDREPVVRVQPTGLHSPPVSFTSVK